MSALDRLRTIAAQARDKRTADGGYRLVDYPMPEPGAFVGEFIATFDPPTVLALLDVAEAADQALRHRAQRQRRTAGSVFRPLVHALDRLREVTSWPGC